MIFANDTNGLSIRAIKNVDAFCPSCNSIMIAKCGEIMIPHWAHKTHDVNCLYRPETQWHLEWKAEAINHGCTVEKRIGNNITDVLISNSRVLELQHSGITAKEIQKRCISYGFDGKHTDWMFDMENKFDNYQLNLSEKDGYFTFRQKWKKSTIDMLFDIYGKHRYGKVWFDVGVYNKLVYVKKLYRSGNGWGIFKTIDDVFCSEPQRWW
jgi:competence CoiA-like predicted nuclease